MIDRIDESGNDELLADAGVMSDVDLKRAEDVERERSEDARTASAPAVNDGDEPDLVEP